MGTLGDHFAVLAFNGWFIIGESNLRIGENIEY